MLAAPPMLGAEYLDADVLAAAWASLLAEVQRELAAFPGPVADYLHAKSPLWNAVGRVHFHLAENKGNEVAPFAFLATYATSLSRQERVQHAPLGRAVEESAGAADKSALLALLRPVQKAAEKSAFLRELVASGEIFHPLAWTPREAYAFLQDIPAFEESGVVVRVPDWWHARRPPRPQVRVSVGAKKPGGLGMDAMLDFQVGLTLDDETLTPAEWRRILDATEPLVLLKGKWVEVDRDKLREVLDHWKAVERQARDEGISFLEGMRLLAGAELIGGARRGRRGRGHRRVDAGDGGAVARGGARRSAAPPGHPRGRSGRRSPGHAPPLPARRASPGSGSTRASASALAWPTTWASARPSRCWRCCSSSSRRGIGARTSWWYPPRSSATGGPRRRASRRACASSSRTPRR